MIYLLHLYGVLKNLHLYKKILPQRFNGWEFPPCLYRNDKWYKHINRIERSFSFQSLIDCPKRIQRETETGSSVIKAVCLSAPILKKILFMWCVCICMCVDVCVLCEYSCGGLACVCGGQRTTPSVIFKGNPHSSSGKRCFNGLKHTEEPRLAAQQAPGTCTPSSPQHMPLFLLLAHMPWGSNSGHRVCKASTLQTEPSL